MKLTILYLSAELIIIALAFIAGAVAPDYFTSWMMVK